MSVMTQPVDACLRLATLDALLETQGRLMFARENYNEEEADQFGTRLLDFMRLHGEKLRAALAAYDPDPPLAGMPALTDRQRKALTYVMENAEHEAGDFDDEDEDAAHARNVWEGLKKLLSAQLAPALQAAMQGFDLLAHLQRQREWSERTFGPGERTAGVLDHIRKELDEVAAAPTDITEWIDLVILALDGAWRAGHEPQAIVAALVAKQTKNEGRSWPDWRTADPNKAIEHDRSADRVKCDRWSCKDGTVVGPYDTLMICGKCDGTGFLPTPPTAAEPGEA